MNAFTIIKLVAIIVALAIFLSSTITFMAESYKEYQEYYQAIMADKEYQKYVETLPLSFDGLSVSLNDGVTYYATGKARPKKDDLTVIAHFSEKGKDFDRILENSEYELIVPTDFADNGGSIIVKYLYQPEKAEDATEDPAPIIRSSELGIQLAPVVLTSVKLVGNPYRVYYSDDMSFDKSGIRLEAIFNSGERVTLDENDVTVSSTKLSTDTKSVSVSYNHGGSEMKVDVPVKVVSAASYSEGDILEIKAESCDYLLDGQSISEANPTVRATYRSGNRLLISADQYTVSGLTEKASFFNSCIIDVALKSNPGISCRTSAEVRFVAEAEQATASEGTVKSTVTAADGSSVSVLENITNGTTVGFTLNSDAIAKGRFTLRIASTADKSLALTDLLALKINGRYLIVPTGIMLEAYDNGYSFIKCTLPDIVVNKGANTVELIFGGMDGFTLALDSVSIETKYDGIISSNTEEHIVNSFASGITNPELTMGLVKEFQAVTDGLYIHGVCTDGRYIYTTRTTDAEEDNKVRRLMVTKYDAITYEIVATSPLSADASCETNAGITYYDGKIIIYYNDGTKWCIDPSLTGEWTEYTDFAFEGTEGSAIRDVYYNNATQQFAVLTGTRITIYGMDMKPVGMFDAQTKTSGLYITRMTATSDYIYVGFTKDGVYNPTIQMYDWSGNYVGKIVITNSNSLTKTNIQGFAFVNGDIVIAQIRWDKKGSEILKATYPKVDAELDLKLTVGEYIAAANDGGVTPTVSASANNKISATGIYAMDGAYDGEYLYISMCGTKNLTATISKVDPVTLQVIGETVTFVPADIDGDNSRIFLKDGKLYCIIRDGSMYEINTDELNGVGCNVTASSLSFAQYGTAFDADWCEQTGKFALITTDKKLHILNEDLSASVKNIELKNGSLAPTSVCTDGKFIYVNYKNGNNKTTNSVDVYTWDGEKVGSFDISGFTLGTDINFNVQAIFFAEGKMHATVCSWTNGQMVYHDWIVNVNEETLK